ncbi:exodeoxyribonuclease V subunit alpha [Georgenia yuyongxinii]|uniref:RecBCD enzyme subunit RecD n=1 Tax=Georgenia yuyongxinii TaxID=2589797 RepID=A0A5B8BZV6_9MICO|nr:exodeoxyribonuclease V subunit alpha [Georgenia yuyongxinii]QDC23337.1 exodeoxyribonuclease V subunit alpha [Georgenia yuyongxinii]
MNAAVETTPAGVSAEAAPADASAEARLALRATPLLGVFNVAGVLGAADVHVAQRLGRLAGERDETVLLAVALAVRAVRAGSVCVRLGDLEALAVPEAEDAAPTGPLPWPERRGWEAAVQASPLVAVGVEGAANRPVRWVDGRLYLDRYWRDELRVRRAADARLAVPIGGAIAADRLAGAVQRLFPAAADVRQRLAAATAVRSRLTVLTGGPGTGKTTTVARVLAVLQDVAGPGLRIALAAPTGKAAARLQEAVRQEVAQFDAVDQERVGTPEATTLHRLLGWRPDSSTRFRHDASHHLPHDVVVVDETSMVSLPLMARLLEALRPEARLLLVGDPDQLASVEAGAVLGDLVGRPPVAGELPEAVGAFAAADLTAGEREQLGNGVVRLTTVYRQERGSQILPLAAAIRDGDADQVMAVLRAGGRSVEFVEVGGDRLTEAEIQRVRGDAEEAGAALVRAARTGDAGGALRALDAHRLMLAHRRGPAGVAHWAALVEGWVAEAARPDGDETRAGAAGASRAGAGRPSTGVSAHGPASLWYPGRPLLVTANDRESGLYNGDTGVIVADGESGVIAVFGDPDAPMRVRPHRLPPVETVHAMTVHRGQGSQFGHVSLILPPAISPLLTRELLYTAVTRARKLVRVLGTEEAVRAAVGRPVRRASGLREPLP